MRKVGLKKMYKDSINYLKESRESIYFGIGLFCFFILLGFFIPPNEAILNHIKDFVEEILGKIEGKSAFGIITFIFFNNLYASFIAMASGIFFSVPTFFIAIINGYILGFISSLSVQVSGAFSLWKLLPHGIFELPALFISLGLGFNITRSIFSKKKGSFKRSLINSLQAFVLIVLPLLVIAAIIEGFLIFYLR